MGYRGTRFILSCAIAAACLAIPFSALGTSPDSRNYFRNTTTGPGVANHPVGIRPSGAVHVPSGWPLAADGTLSCMTCHSAPPMGKNAGNNLRGNSRSGNDPRAFCLSCHEESGTGTAMHWQAVGKAHITLKENRDGSARLSQESDSRGCLSCHDGVMARDPGHRLAGSGGDFGDGSKNHPVGVRYPFSGKTRAEVPLRPAASVPATVSLAGGVVSCTSCHNLYAEDTHRLSVPIEGSQLCFACHDLD